MSWPEATLGAVIVLGLAYVLGKFADRLHKSE